MKNTYHLSDRGRRALDQLYANIERLNGAPSVHRSFSVDPTAEQRLEDMQRQQVDFLDRINIMPVRDLIGQPLRIGAVDLIATTRSTMPRNPQYVGEMDEREYRLYTTMFDTMLPWQVIDAWSKFPDFASRYSKHVARSVGLSRIMVGWNGISRAADSDKSENPLGQDINIGWLQKLRLERPDHVMGRATAQANGVTTATGAAAPIYIGADANHAEGDYKNIDALAYDLIAGMPPWARNAPNHVVMVSQDLVDEKYFPMINRPLNDSIDGGRSMSDEIVSSVIMSTKQIGGRPAAIVPYFPEGTMLITPINRPGATNEANLSIYQQEGSRRRYILDKPELMASLVDYNSVNEGYVIESTDFAVMAENITFGARP